MKLTGGSMNNKYYRGHVDFEDIKKLSPDKKDDLATILSEGNNKLKEYLLNCWKHNIKTFACCKGHDKYNLAYVGFEIDENSIDYINMLLNNLESIDYSVLSISSANNDVFDNPKLGRFAFDIQIDYKHSNHLFETLNSYLSIRNKKEKLNELLKHSILINQIFINSEISTCIMKTNKNKLRIDITKPKTHNPPHYDGNLDKVIENIKSKNKILLNQYDCNNESLINFIRCFYKNYNPNKIKRRTI